MEENQNIQENENLPALNTSSSPEELADFIAAVLDSKKAQDIQKIKVGEKTIIADWFVLCTGSSSTQVRSLTDEVDYRAELCGVKPLRVEGRDNQSWVIMDFGSVILHVFSRDARKFYNLEKLYGEAAE